MAMPTKPPNVSPLFYCVAGECKAEVRGDGWHTEGDGTNHSFNYPAGWSRPIQPTQSRGPYENPALCPEHAPKG